MSQVVILRRRLIIDVAQVINSIVIAMRPRSVQKLECTTLANESYGLANKLAILEPPRSDRRDRVTLVTAKESSCITIVIFQHATKPFATEYISIGCPDLNQWIDQPIIQTLVVSLMMIEFKEFADGPS